MTETTYDGIIGMDRALDECDALMFRIRREWVSYEGALYRTKWFDYRYLHPVKATYLYADAFKTAYRRLYRETIDYRAADAIKPLKKDDLFECPPALISSVWRGRQHADALGVPYNLYTQWAIEACLRFWNRNHLPRPQQLYSGHVCEFVEKKWEDHQRGSLNAGSHFSFQAQNYAGTPTQIAHHEWLFEQAGKRENMLSSLIAMFKRGLLPLDKIKDRFGEGVSQRVFEAA